MTFHKLRQVKALSDIHRLLSGNKNNFTPEWMAFIKKIYLHPKFGSWNLLKLFSKYMHTVPSRLNSLKKSSWNSQHTWQTEPTPRFDAHRTDTQFSTTSTKYLFPAERSLLKLRSKQTRETNNFSALFWGEFFNSTWRSQIFPNVSSPTRGMACVVSHVILVSQSYCRVRQDSRRDPGEEFFSRWDPGGYRFLGGILAEIRSGNFSREGARRENWPPRRYPGGFLVSPGNLGRIPARSRYLFYKGFYNSSYSYM